MIYMFKGAKTFNQPLNDWDTQNVRCMIGMFEGATSFDQPLDQWDMRSIEVLEDVENMFRDATSYRQPANKRPDLSGKPKERKSRYNLW